MMHGGTDDDVVSEDQWNGDKGSKLPFYVLASECAHQPARAHGMPEQRIVDEGQHVWDWDWSIG